MYEYHLGLYDYLRANLLNIHSLKSEQTRTLLEQISSNNRVVQRDKPILIQIVNAHKLTLYARLREFKSLVLALGDLTR